MTFLSREQLNDIGFSSLGNNVLISDKASIYGAPRIHIGNNVRIDDFCVLSAGEGEISIGDYIHIAVYSSLIGSGRIVISDYAGISSRVSIYSSSDDYSGEYMCNPTIPAEYTNVIKADVTIGRHAIIGCGAIILPGVTLHDGVAIGALSLVVKDCDAFGVYSGNPARKMLLRKRNLLEKESIFMTSNHKI